MGTWITIREASVLLDKSVSTVRRMIKRDPNILTRLENSPNGGFKMFLQQETLVKSFEANKSAYENAESHYETAQFHSEEIQARPATEDIAAQPTYAGDSMKDRLESFRIQNNDLKVELERWKGRSDEYKNRFEHELLERYRERKLFSGQMRTKDDQLLGLNDRLKESNFLLAQEQKRVVELAESYAPSHIPVDETKTVKSIALDGVMIVFSIAMLLGLVALFFYLLV